MLDPIVAPIVKNVAGYLLTSKLGGGRKSAKSGLLGSLTKGLSLPTLMIVGFVAGYGYKSFADPEVHEQVVEPEIVRRPGEMSWQLYFSPNGGCTDAIVRELRAAKQEVRVMAYSFTAKPIAQALVDCHRRGVNVAIILDQGQRGEKYTEADFVAHAGIPTYLDGKHAIHHNKVVVIDGQTVITGSFNFSSSAESRNAENLLVFRDTGMAQRYKNEWQRHQMHSDRHVGRGQPPASLSGQTPQSYSQYPPAPPPQQQYPPPSYPAAPSSKSEPTWLPWRPGK